ncbi:MAG TPA: phosphatase PAP2 family protein [Gemmataceae bacterium]|nr:phosphatase PAP2 family protein [Gemmataceae bacterium]
MICTDADSLRPDLSWPVQVLVRLSVTAALVTALYFFIDQPVMVFFRDCELGRYRFLKWLTRPPEAFVLLSPVVLLAGLLRRWFTPWNRGEKMAVAAAVSTLLTALAALLLKITFGRSADGFHPFHLEPAYWMFPSGHTACTLCVAVVAQVALPRWRLFWWAIVGIVAATLIALTHHFVGDILGGAFLGWAIGGTVTRALGL